MRGTAAPLPSVLVAGGVRDECSVSGLGVTRASGSLTFEKHHYKASVVHNERVGIGCELCVC